MEKTNTSREMSPKNIVKTFDYMFDNKCTEELIAFTTLYPHFTKTYIDICLNKLSILNTIVSNVRTND